MAPQGDNYAIGMCVMILLSRVIPQIMASSRFGEPSTARSHSRLKAIIFALELIEAVTM